MMNSEIFSHYNSKTNLALYINDKMNPEDEKKNRIYFEIAQHNSTNNKIAEVFYFMEILDAKYIAHRILSGQFSVGELYNKVRGKNGEARAFSTTRQPNPERAGSTMYTIKIDTGSGTVKEGGITALQVKEKTFYYNMTEETMMKAMIQIRDRIFIREYIWMQNIGLHE